MENAIRDITFENIPEALINIGYFGHLFFDSAEDFAEALQATYKAGVSSFETAKPFQKIRPYTTVIDYGDKVLFEIIYFATTTKPEIDFTIKTLYENSKKRHNIYRGEVEFIIGIKIAYPKGWDSSLNPEEL